ncbi:uncharacterized protein PGTG_22354 [Puccinia graminis f. sp. tritici CRL 75-36-700-3]|uniref:Uncharacterized protein n=1 Tax=Puccinia graminis f. sp. tritici (strain CRL 75-36-700-3 / race SCCL) TaxID=418459 RepID=H6QU60_PUCGT|nr:uncharacterized protein PGTG_22354 [Puccinia graminis f. sp. tritici CRL 75-36-700-3]EHS64474.1 hypothetical protein PGTG_22354 [Puccinia graminis f. sp. tritici CRL 75-36-700-3]
MVLLPKRLFFCVVLNEIVAAARLTLSSITEEAHAAQDAPIIVPSNVDLGGSSSVIAISKPTRPGAQKQLVEKDYGIIPDGLPERKDQVTRAKDR